VTDILAIDLASTTGFARGKVGDAFPVCGSVVFGGRRDALGDAVFHAAMDWAFDLLGKSVPDVVLVESLLPPDAMKTHTSRAVRDRLAGLHGIVRAVAHKLGVGEISEAAVGDVRAHFISTRTLKRKAAKLAVMRQCKALDWTVANDNEGDAAALWSYGCALVDPKNALTVVPLFNPKLKVSVWP
jgi:hypothetical protein